MKIFWLLTVLFVLLLGGCTGTQVPVVLEAVGSSGEITETVASYTSEASMEKERELMKTYRNRDIQRAKMYEFSGFNMEWVGKEKHTIQTFIIDGKPITIETTTTEYLPKIAYREEPEFEQALPLEPSEHPVWDASTSWVSTIAKFGLIGWGISEVGSVLKAGYDNAGNHFYGDDIDFNKSFNQTSRSQGVNWGAQGDVCQGGSCPQGPIEEPADFCPEDIECSCETWLETGGTCIK